MSSPPPSEASTFPVTLLRIKNALFKSSKKANKEPNQQESNQQEPNQQEQSRLIQLPGEIREIIWHYVLGGKKIELQKESILREQRFWGCKYTLPCLEDRWRTTTQMDDGSCLIDPFLPILRHDTGLLRTCRLVQQEVIDELYCCNRFMFNLISFRLASEEIMSHHFARLRIISFWHVFDRDDRESWAQLCKTIAGMPILHTLHMKLFSTSRTYHEHHKKQESGGSHQAPQNSSDSPKEPGPISMEEFILNSLYQSEQVKEFKVQLEPRSRRSGFRVPLGHSNAPFKLICEYEEDVQARNKQLQQEQRDRELMKRQEEAEKRIMAQEEADRLRFEMEQKAQDVVQSFSG